MLLSITEAKRLKYLVNDSSGRSEFLYNDNGAATKDELQYAVDMHEDYTFAFGKPFIGNIDELKSRLAAE